MNLNATDMQHRGTVAPHVWPVRFEPDAIFLISTGATPVGPLGMMPVLL